MNIRLIRFCKKENQAEIQKKNNSFIDDVNNHLFDDDLMVTSSCSSSLFDMLLIESDGILKDFMDYYQNHKGLPFFLVSTRTNNAFKEALDINSFLLEEKEKPVLFEDDDHNIASLIIAFSKIYSTVDKVKHLQVGLLGVDDKSILFPIDNVPPFYQKVGINIIKIGQETIIDESSKPKLGKIPHISVIEKCFKDKNELKDFKYLYLSIKKLIEQYHFDAVGISLPKYQKYVPLIVSLLLEEGISASKDFSLPSLVSLFILNSLSDLPSFNADIVSLDLVKNKVNFATSTIPLHLLGEFKIDSSLQIKGKLSTGEISLVGASYDFNNCFAFFGNIKEAVNKSDVFGIGGSLILEEDSPFGFYKAASGGTISMCYSNISNEYITVVNMLYNFANR